jgi:hypothetical protein
MIEVMFQNVLWKQRQLLGTRADVLTGIEKEHTTSLNTTEIIKNL